MSIVLLTATPKWIDLGNNGGAGFAFFNGAAGGSISAWVNTTRITGNDQSIVGAAIGPAGGTSASSRLRLLLTAGFPSLIGRTLDANSPTTVVGTTVLVINTWTHVVGTFDGATRLASLYVNGVATGTGTFTNSTAGNFSATNSKNGAIGSGVSGVDTWFDGQLADLRMYNVVLTADEIKTMWAMMGHDAIRRTAGTLQLAYPLNDAASGVVATTANLRDVSGANLAPLPFAVNGAPVFSAAPLAMRRAA
jgi:hypothetical protein